MEIAVPFAGTFDMYVSIYFPDKASTFSLTYGPKQTFRPEIIGETLAKNRSSPIHDEPGILFMLMET